MEYLLGIDVGTVRTKAILYDHQLQAKQTFRQTYTLYRDATGMAEQEPTEVLAAVEKVINDAYAEVQRNHCDLLAVAFSSENQSLILLDENFQPLTRVLTWADTRARQVASRIKRNLVAKELYMDTGTPIHPMSPFTKLLWLKEDQPELLKKTAYVADIKSYLFKHFFDEFKVDISVASCSGMWNINTRTWDEQALAMTDITAVQLPEIVDSTQQAHGLTAAGQMALQIPADTPFVYGAFGGAASNIGMGAVDESTAAIAIGTSAAVRVMTDHPVIDPQQRLFCYALDEEHWVIGGPLNNGGDVYQWAVKHLVDANAVASEQVDAFQLANQVIEGVPAGSHGLIFHPFLGGERAPIWDANARGSFFGLNQLHTRADMLRAVMEGITMNVGSVFEIVRDLVGDPKQIMASGGFTDSLVWRQMLADVIGFPVGVAMAHGGCCLGAAAIALKSLGRISDYSEVTPLLAQPETYIPDDLAAYTYQKYQPLFNQVEELLTPAYAAIAQLQEK